MAAKCPLLLNRATADQSVFSSFPNDEASGFLTKDLLLWQHRTRCLAILIFFPGGTENNHYPSLSRTLMCFWRSLWCSEYIFFRHGRPAPVMCRYVDLCVFVCEVESNLSLTSECASLCRLCDLSARQKRGGKCSVLRRCVCERERKEIKMHSCSCVCLLWCDSGTFHSVVFVTRSLNECSSNYEPSDTWAITGKQGASLQSC